MECSRCSVVSESSHEVKTLDKAKEWFSCSQENHLPVTINQFKARNGRLRIEVYDKDGSLLHCRG